MSRIDKTAQLTTAPSADGRGARILATGVSRLIFVAVNSLAGLVAVGVSLRSLGPAEFGLLSTLISLQVLMAFADLGIGTSVTNAVAAASTETDMRRVIGLVYRAVLMLSVVGLVIVVIALTVASGDRWGSVVGSTSPEIDSAVVVALLSFAGTLPLAVGERVLLGLQRQYLANTILLSRAVLLVGLVAAAAHQDDPSLVAFTAAQSLPGILSYAGVALAAVVVLRRESWPLGWNASTVRSARLAGTSLPAFIGTVLHALLFGSQRLFVNGLVSSTEVARYALGLQAYSPAYGLVQGVGIGIWPAFDSARSTGDHSWIARSWRRWTTWAALAIVPILILFPLGAYALARIVSGGTELLDPWAYAGFGVVLACQIVVQPSLGILMLPRGLWLQVTALALTTLVSLPLVLWSTPRLGAAGAIWSIAVGYSTCYVPLVLWGARREIASLSDLHTTGPRPPST